MMRKNCCAGLFNLCGAGGFCRRTGFSSFWCILCCIPVCGHCESFVPAAPARGEVKTAAKLALARLLAFAEKSETLAGRCVSLTFVTNECRYSTHLTTRYYTS